MEQRPSINSRANVFGQNFSVIGSTRKFQRMVSATVTRSRLWAALKCIEDDIHCMNDDYKLQLLFYA